MAYPVQNFEHLIGLPGFSDQLLSNHFKLYEGYVKTTNELLAKIKTVDSSSFEYGALKRRVGWEFDGMRLHELYFGNLGGKTPLSAKSELFEELSRQWGNFDQWKKDFIATGTIRGIGWALLYLDMEENKLYNVWINEHDTGHLVKGKPILIMDVFEHAFMPQFGLDKIKYIEAFFENIDWVEVSNRYSNSRKI